MDDILATRARRALELGRARSSLASAALVTFVLAALSLVVRGLDPRWLALPFATWALVVWCGGALARGGLVGLVAGAAGWLVPMSILRPCCAAMQSGAMQGASADSLIASARPLADCCTRPECCLEAGLALGVIIGLLAPSDRGRSSMASIGGMLLVAGSTLAVRCTGLFLGESLGLLGGLALGAVMLGGVRAMIARPATA